MNVQSEDKKQRILDATMELIAEKGLHDTPMSQVSRRAGVSAGTIYHYFSGKEEIINYLYVNLKKDLNKVIMSNMETGLPYKERFFGLWRNYYDYLIANPLQLSFIEQCANSPLISEKTKEETLQYREAGDRFVQEGIDSGYFRNTDTQLILHLINGSVITAAKLHLSGMLDITDKMREYAADFCWNGLGA